MLPNTLYCYPFESQIPELRDALAVLQTVGIRTAILGETDQRPKNALCIIPKADYERLTICGAALVVERRLSIPVRWDTEKPVGSIEHAKSRGFSDEQIAAELRPWRAAGVLKSEQAVQEAEAAAKAARADLVEARERAARPLDDPAG